jgi:hypothetical protein
MGEILLQDTLGHAQADAAVQEVIRVYEDAFPDKIAGYYVEGSYADQTYLATSDIDLVIVFRHHFADLGTRKAAQHIWSTSQHANMMEVDITVEDEESLRGGVDPMLKLGSRLIYGEDICSAYPLVPITAWTRQRMHAAYWLLVTVYQRPIPVRQPLSFPDPLDEFYGYANRLISVSEGKEVPSTRNLIRTTGWAATALLALQAGQYAVRKRDCARLYRYHIRDTWSSLLEEITTFCQDEWHYLLPEEMSARRQLRALCERTLSFEEHFLALYKRYLLEQLHSTEQEHARIAIELQEQLPLDDEEVKTTLQMIQQRDT